MIIRSPHAPPRSVVDSVAASAPHHTGPLLSADQFQFEIAKEVSRSNRRDVFREFAIVRFPELHDHHSAHKIATIKSRAQSRMRISDSIGWLDHAIAILLPETDRDGALHVANEMSKRLGNDHPVETEVFTYPWDDELISGASDLQDPSSGLSDGPLSVNGPPNRLATRKNRSTPEATESLQNCNSSSNAFSPLTRKINQKGAPFRHFSPTPRWKRSIDILGAATGLLLLSPLLAFVSLAIKLTSPGPIFYRQQREGKDGRIFSIVKFRTMVPNAEQLQESLRPHSEQDGPAFKLKDDPRVTPIGKYLRRSCIDELPQLWNVLVGQMSLVGPRPLPVSESQDCQPWQRVRLTVLPGLTCTWQANAARDVSFDDWMRLDLMYIEQRSFWFDLKLIVKTAGLALLHRGSI